VVATEVGEVVRQLLEVLVAVVVVALELLELEAQEQLGKDLLVVILGQRIMLEAVAALVQLGKTSIPLLVEMVVQVFVQP
jgi:hypothetical protein